MKKTLAFHFLLVYSNRACLRRENGAKTLQSVEKSAFPTCQDAESCCAIREFLPRIVGPRDRRRSSRVFCFEWKIRERTEACTESELNRTQTSKPLKNQDPGSLELQGEREPTSFRIAIMNEITQTFLGGKTKHE